MKFLRLFTMLALLCLVSSLQAAFLRNVPRQLVQPNGDTLHCFASGDEYYHWLHDAEGFTIVQNPATGYFVYADKAGDQLIPTHYVAGKVTPASVGLVPHTNISPEQWQERRSAVEKKTPQMATPKTGDRNRGVINNLVIFIRFSDDTGFNSSFSEVEGMFNAPEAGANSMYNYFKSASYNQLEIFSNFYPAPSGDIILSYQDMHPRAYYQPYSATNTTGYTDDDEARTREHTLLQRAVQAVSASIPPTLNIDYNNDGAVDNICFIVKGDVGDWSDLLWPHRWVLYSEEVYIGSARVWDYNFQLEDLSYFTNSTLCHEMFHTLGAPDLYHYYYDTDFHAVGVWDLMDINLSTPQQSGAYMKYLYGNWIDDIPEITTPGTYTLHPINSATSNKVCYVIASENPDEFFVLEYRKFTSPFDQVVGSGLLIYRINTLFAGYGNAQYNGIDVLDEVYIYRPNGDAYAAAAHFSADNGNTSFNSTTNPAPYLSDGTLSAFSISNITTAGDSIRFTYGNPSAPYLSVGAGPLTVANELDASTTFAIASNISWTISGAASWLNVSTPSGSGDETITLTVTGVNTSTEERSCVLTISGSGVPNQYITVIQPGITITPYIDVSFPSVDLGNFTGSLAFFDIYANVDWSILGAASWLELNAATGTGNATIMLTATEVNPLPTERTCNLTVKSNNYDAQKNVLVIQSAASDITVYADDQSVILYPNPVNGHLSIYITPLLDVNYAVMLNSHGQEVLKKEITGNDELIHWNLSGLKSGLYVIRFFSDTKTISRKIVVQ